MHNNMIKSLIGLGVILALVLVVAGGFFYSQENIYRDCVVTSKDRTTKTDSNGNSSSDARVYTENCGTFKVADTMLKGKFNSADTFGSIQEGETYTFTTIGYRNGFLSQFPNIIEVR